MQSISNTLATSGTWATSESRTAPTSGLRGNTALSNSAPYLDNLTATDLEVVYQATGVRLDENSRTFPLLAADIAMDRQTGALPAGRDIGVDYLSAMAKKYGGDEWKDSLGAQIDEALDYLARRGGQPGFDLLA